MLTLSLQMFFYEQHFRSKGVEHCMPVLNDSPFTACTPGSGSSCVAFIALCLPCPQIILGPFWATTHLPPPRNKPRGWQITASIQIWPMANFYMVLELRMVFGFSKDWGKKSKEESYFLTCGNSMELSLPCPLIKFYWDTAMLILS